MNFGWHFLGGRIPILWISIMEFSTGKMERSYMRQKIVGAVFRVLLFLGLVDYINYPDWTWVETDGILHKEYVWLVVLR